ncbi:inositol monophosphatase [Bosea sp. BK604]|uniref:inositol monophosphatase family protein n=1 Tax=Bosea sp. BK604 TaxID=2512180 RepID=UPI0010470FF6|nr:inositol monophosphatase [Bosea sp. BK604]TCR64597.1 myo-inositol-1(or 4)-monophosphatase [Bosea sp. BK604]
MKLSEPSEEWQLIRSLIREAGALARVMAARRAEIDRRAKANPLDLVTEADLAIESHVRLALAQHWPSDRFWGEEGGRPDVPDRGRVWICDPIDGTRSFLRFGHDYCVSLGLLVDGAMKFAAIYDPARDDLYEAEAGAGAWLNGSRLSPSTRVPDPHHALVALGFSERVDTDRHVEMVRAILQAGAACHQHGSGALALAQTAAGRLDAYVELHQNAWDALPGLLIAEEAGCLCLAWSDADLIRGGLTLAANSGVAGFLASLVSTTPEWGVKKALRPSQVTQAQPKGG